MSYFRMKKMMIRWSWLSALVTFLFWGIYYFVNKSIPQITKVQVSDQMLQLPFSISWLWSIVVVPMLSVGVIYLRRKTGHQYTPFIVGLVSCIIFGMNGRQWIVGTFFCVLLFLKGRKSWYDKPIGSLFIGMFIGLGVGVIVGMLIPAPPIVLCFRLIKGIIFLFALSMCIWVFQFLEKFIIPTLCYISRIIKKGFLVVSRFLLKIRGDITPAWKSSVSWLTGR